MNTRVVFINFIANVKISKSLTLIKRQDKCHSLRLQYNALPQNTFLQIPPQEKKRTYRTKRLHNSIFSFTDRASLSESGFSMGAFINAIMRSAKAAFRRAPCLTRGADESPMSWAQTLPLRSVIAGSGRRTRLARSKRAFSERQLPFTLTASLAFRRQAQL